jgi:hypothetical protein
LSTSTLTWVIVIAAVFALFSLFMSFRYLGRRRLIADLPTSKVKGVFIGQVELKGSAESDRPLTSYLAGTRCVFYRWHVSEHWSRISVHMTKNGPVAHRESGWKEVDRGEESPPFYLKDDTDIIRIIPRGAELHTAETFDETCGRDDPLYFGKGPVDEVSNSTHRRRFREDAIPLHAPIYATGYARERKDVVAPEIARDKRASLFVIAMHSEKELGQGYLLWGWSWFILGLLSSAGIGFAYNASQPLPTAGISTIPIACYLFLFLAGWLWTVFNSLIRLRNRVKQAWSQVDVQLKRRSDLIPRLVEAVAGYRAYERGLQTALAELRAQATAPAIAAPVSGILKAIKESYPELKANESFLKLQEELADTENRIALARTYYNDAATFYNIKLQIIPERFIALLAGMKRKELFLAEGFERVPVQVKLAE